MIAATLRRRLCLLTVAIVPAPYTPDPIPDIPFANLPSAEWSYQSARQLEWYRDGLLESLPDVAGIADSPFFLNLWDDADTWRLVGRLQETEQSQANRRDAYDRLLARLGPRPSCWAATLPKMPWPDPPK